MTILKNLFEALTKKNYIIIFYPVRKVQLNEWHLETLPLLMGNTKISPAQTFSNM